MSSFAGTARTLVAVGTFSLVAGPDTVNSFADTLGKVMPGQATSLIRQSLTNMTKHNATGITIFVVEQNATMALGIADRGYVLQSGRVVLADTAQRLLENPQMQRAYLGM